MVHVCAFAVLMVAALRLHPPRARCRSWPNPICTCMRRHRACSQTARHKVTPSLPLPTCLVVQVVCSRSSKLSVLLSFSVVFLNPPPYLCCPPRDSPSPLLPRSPSLWIMSPARPAWSKHPQTPALFHKALHRAQVGLPGSGSNMFVPSTDGSNMFVPSRERIQHGGAFKGVNPTCLCLPRTDPTWLCLQGSGSNMGVSSRERIQHGVACASCGNLVALAPQSRSVAQVAVAQNISMSSGAVSKGSR
eukprot:336667-Chlamydomonas_euryale.AAC.8